MSESDQETRETLAEARREAKEALEAAKHHAELGAKICPLMSSGNFYEHCQIDKCAWWNEQRDKCGMLPLN